MNVNDLYRDAVGDNQLAEKNLFQALRASFRVILQHKNIKAEDAEEIIQEALITIGKKYKVMEEINNFSAWSYVVLRNKLIDFLKVKKYTKYKPTLELTDSYPDKQTHIDNRLLDKLINCFRKVSKKNPKQARILNLNFQGFPTEEICKKLGITRNNMYSILSRARSLLEYCLEKGDLK
ncbi:MAG: sigma-70 family RNA polymerase sigma factor [Candidatus Zixiibacteriota bacterium]